MQNNYETKQKFKYTFIFTAIIIAIVSVWVTNVLMSELKEEERKKIEIWAKSLHLISNSSDSTSIMNEYDNLLFELMQGNTTIPVIVTDTNGAITQEPMNIQVPENGRDAFLQKKVNQFRKNHDPIVLEVDGHPFQYVYYDDSTVLKRLQIFPFAQLGVVFIFIVISFLALNSSKKAEQNKVWVGLSKETAHQLGTPISSLMAWVEYLKTKNTDLQLLEEMDKDVQRLKTIAERFSKIGSNPDPEPMNLNEVILQAVGYMNKRISSKVTIDCRLSEKSVRVLMNESLFGWAIENLIKNAVDAMNGQGKITITLQEKGKRVLLDVSDTGKGIARSKFDAIFHPGYTTKKRGWGLGLSLVRRIIESYQKGKIYVLHSELNKGTTFRIELNKYDNE